MIRTFKRKLKPSKAQAKRIASWIGACRVVYNLGLEIKIAAWKNQHRSLSAFELMSQLPELKKDCPWTKDVPSGSLQAVPERLDKSYQTFFKGGGFPHWATRKRYRSLQLKSLKVAGHSVHLPKVGSIRMVRDAPVHGTPKTAQIVIEPTGIFICIQCELPDQKLCSENQAAVGIDLGISHFCILSDGSLVENPKHFGYYRRRLRQVNCSLARKKKGSRGWKCQAKQVSRSHHRIANARRDFPHKTSTLIAKSYFTVYVEELNIRGMSKNPHLSRHILDAGWGMFVQMLAYKTCVVKVPAPYTSQTCNSCGATDVRSRVSQSQFLCIHCGHAAHADVNAAKNILSRGAALVRQREAVACA